MMDVKAPPWKEVCREVTNNGLLVLHGSFFDTILNKNSIDAVYAVEQSPFARGKFASVRKATHRETAVDYAAKVIRRRRRVQDLRNEILHEIAVLAMSSHAKHEQIVTLKEVFETPVEITLILELAEGGELQRVIDEELSVTEPGAVSLLRQIVGGLQFLHSRNVAHLDVKPQNILLTSTYPNCDVKLCDFGLSRVVAGSGIEIREILGTPDYTAPEVLNYEPITMAADMWSVGVLAYVLLSGFTPFGGDTKQETYCNISQAKLDFPDDLFDGVSEHAIDFIRRTIHIDPRERLSATGCLEHRWLSGGIPRLLPEAPQDSVNIVTALSKTARSVTSVETVTVTVPSYDKTAGDESEVTKEAVDNAQSNLHNNSITDSILSDDGTDSGTETLSNGSDNPSGSNNGPCDLALIPDGKSVSGEAQVHRMTTGRVTKLVDLWEHVGHGARRPSGEMGKENVMSPPPPAKRRELKP